MSDACNSIGYAAFSLFLSALHRQRGTREGGKGEGEGGRMEGGREGGREGERAKGRERILLSVVKVPLAK